MQCRRAWLPTVEPLTGFAGVAGRPGAAIADARVARGSIVTRHRLLIVGPEGGWSPEELECSPAQGRARATRAPGGDGGHRGRCAR